MITQYPGAAASVEMIDHDPDQGPRPTAWEAWSFVAVGVVLLLILHPFILAGWLRDQFRHRNEP